MAQVQHSILVKCSPATVYQAATDSAGLAGWWTRGVSGTGRPGSTWMFRFESGAFNEMRVVSLQPDRLVEWECVGGADEWVGTRVTFDIASVAEGTRVTFVHGDWREATPYMAECGTHWGEYMKSLRSYCDAGVGSPDRGRPNDPNSSD